MPVADYNNTHSSFISLSHSLQHEQVAASSRLINITTAITNKQLDTYNHNPSSPHATHSIYIYVLYPQLCCKCTSFSFRSRLADVCADRDKHREAFENQNRTVIDLEAECELLRKRIESLENDRERDKKEIARLTDALNRARIVSAPSIFASVW